MKLLKFWIILVSFSIQILLKIGSKFEVAEPVPVWQLNI